MCTVRIEFLRSLLSVRLCDGTVLCANSTSASLARIGQITLGYPAYRYAREVELCTKVSRFICVATQSKNQ